MNNGSSVCRGGGRGDVTHRGIHACIEHAIWDIDVVGADSSIFPLGRGAETGSNSRKEETQDWGTIRYHRESGSVAAASHPNRMHLHSFVCI